MPRRLSCAVILALLCAPAMAQDAPAPPVEKALTPAARAKLAPRRPTRQIVGSPLPIVTEGYRPTLTTRPADPIGTLPIHPTPSNPAPPMPMPVPAGGCDAGGCSGADGVRYNSGAAGVVVDPAGRTCHKVGTTIQCF